jgi:hypothetical protein
MKSFKTHFYLRYCHKYLIPRYVNVCLKYYMIWCFFDSSLQEFCYLSKKDLLFIVSWTGKFDLKFFCQILPLPYSLFPYFPLPSPLFSPTSLSLSSFLYTIFFLCLWDRVSPCIAGLLSVAWVQVILPPQPPKLLGLQIIPTYKAIIRNLIYLFFKKKPSDVTI